MSEVVLNDAITMRYGAQHDASLRSVPPSVFTDGYHGTISTPAGNTLQCEVTDRSVYIFDPSEIINAGHFPNVDDDPTYRFSVVLQESDLLLFYIRNRNPLSHLHPERRHDDIHPTALAARSIDYFQSRGLQPAGIESEWRSSVRGLPVAADNLLTYWDNLEQTKSRWRRPTQEQRIQAAARTKAGLRAVRLGFPNVVSVVESERGEAVTCIFMPESQ